MSRIMMHVRDATRPLSFDARGRREPLEVSARAPWRGVPFEVHRMGALGEIGESGPLLGEYGLMIITRGSYEATVRGPCGDVRVTSRPGTLYLLSGDERPHVLRIRGNAEAIALHLAPEWLEYLPAEKLGRRGPLTGGRTALALVAAMREEVARGCSAGRLYAESLSLSLLSYAFNLMPAEERGASGARLSPVEQERIVEYVHEHLDKQLSLAVLASLVDMPPRQFTARFRAAFGTSPHKYVMRVRLQRGARLLASGRHEIADIALRTGFASQSHFTTAFRRAFGETPRRYASSHRSAGARGEPAAGESA